MITWYLVTQYLYCSNNNSLINKEKGCQCGLSTGILSHCNKYSVTNIFSECEPCYDIKYDK